MDFHKLDSHVGGGGHGGEVRLGFGSFVDNCDPTFEAEYHGVLTSYIAV